MFTNRTQAGQMLAKKLQNYHGNDTVIYALPRGGVILGYEVAKALNAPLDLIITRKIGHPQQPEYAIAATAENGDIIGHPEELKAVSQDWLKQEIELQRKEAKRRRKLYLGSLKSIPAEEKTAILIDDGVATGFTLRVGILELRHRKPKKIVVAVPVISRSIADIVRSEADELVALDIPKDNEFLGAVSAYYDEFLPVEDEEVIALMKSFNSKTQNGKSYPALY